MLHATLRYLEDPLFINHLGHLKGEQPYLGDLLTMVINHLPKGMILQIFDPNNELPPTSQVSSLSFHWRSGS